MNHPGILLIAATVLAIAEILTTVWAIDRHAEARSERALRRAAEAQLATYLTHFADAVDTERQAGKD